MTRADQTAIGLFISMMVIEARKLPTREARIAFMVGHKFRGPHYYITRDVVEITQEVAERLADKIEATNEQAQDHPQGC